MVKIVVMGTHAPTVEPRYIWLTQSLTKRIGGVALRQDLGYCGPAPDSSNRLIRIGFQRVSCCNAERRRTFVGRRATLTDRIACLLCRLHDSEKDGEAND
jgi:hypothetical protein